MAGPNNFLLQQIAQGARFDGADRMYKGAQQGANMLANIQQQQDRNALAQATPMLAQGNIQGAMQSLGGAGQFDAVQKLRAEQAAAAEAQRKANMPLSSYGRTMFDETRGLVPRGTAQRQIGAIGKNGTNVTVNTGNIPLGKKAFNDTQADILAGRSALTRIDGFMKDYQPTWLTYKGQLENAGRRLYEKAGGSLPAQDRKSLQSYTKFRQGVERDFNQYRKEITGAAAALQELSRLKDAIYNTNQSPSEFEAAVQAYKDEIARTDQARINLLRRGIDPRTPEGGMQLDAEIFSASSNTPSAQGLMQQPQQQDGVVDYQDFFNEDGQ